jgi:hypothetical protein
MKSPAAEIETPLTTLITGPARLAPDSLQAAPSAPELVAPRRRGRPVEMAPETVLERIRGLSERREGLFRVHRTHPALYARARRLFGSWEGAVRACGLDYGQIVHRAFERAAQTRRRAQRRTFVTLP